MDPFVGIERFREILPLICSKETSYDSENWTPENPLSGHCAVVSLLAQNLFGGQLVRASLENIPGFEYMRSHYANKLKNGAIQDFTAPQFGDKYPPLRYESFKIRKRSYVLSYPEVVKRYKLLALRFAKVISDGNPIFDDPIYQKCFYAALDSPCQKMKFGCVITHNGKVIYEGCNKTIGSLKSLCEPTCVRLSITSRTESMIGACAHAEEGIWEVIHRGIPIGECELYIAGLYANCFPWIKQKAEHTCLRCAVQMYLAKILRIYMPVKNQWVGISTEKALETALAYATQEKNI